MGLAHLRAGDVEQAVDELMAAVRAYPGDAGLAAALAQALERFTAPISASDLEDEGGFGPEAGPQRLDEPPTRAGTAAPPTGRPAHPPSDVAARQDAAWEAARRDLAASDTFGPGVETGAEPVPHPEWAARPGPDDAFGAESARLRREAASVAEAAARAEAAGMGEPPFAGAAYPPVRSADPAPPRLDATTRLHERGPAAMPLPDPVEPPAMAQEATVRTEEPAPSADPPTDRIEQPEIPEPAAQPDLTSLRPAPPAGAPAVEQRTVLMSGEPGKRASWTGRTRKATLAGATFATAITLAMGAVSTYRALRTDVADVGRRTLAVAPAPDPSEAVAPEVTVPAATPEPSRPAPPSDREAKKPRRHAVAKPAADSLAASELAPEPPAEPPASLPASGPSYAFMDRLGVPVPPGGILDAENSDTRQVLAAGGRRRDDAFTLTFRTPAAVDEIVGFYGSAGINGFQPHTVTMGGRFQGVQRTVARATAFATGGREARITISNPGVDFAAMRLVPESTIKIEIF